MGVPPRALAPSKIRGDVIGCVFGIDVAVIIKVGGRIAKVEVGNEVRNVLWIEVAVTVPIGWAKSADGPSNSVVSSRDGTNFKGRSDHVEVAVEHLNVLGSKRYRAFGDCEEVGD